ncbi:hypothetical protein F0919_07965 [Taibaiella lutea]|uniref:DUF5689 domain-containing protein n=1 Tax=Taibaiella lutea TaxID=2608001 RepID=A0A5M6CHM0_9BACT|nr:DUF5689 domain-containing protein [Taibaiella lutea]KAA5534547.1 hypothetical protein F0919_07965 [Taibaiella lutea]
MKRIFSPILSFLLLASMAVNLSSCLKKDFDTPPDESSVDPHLKVTHTIAQLKSLPQTQIDSNVVISGIVCMDDRSGNYYKKIVIQDSTGGIEVLIDQTNLYTDYPVGRKIYIKCKGLSLGSYHGLSQLGNAPDAQGSLTMINGTTVGDYIVKATFPNKIKVDTLSYSDLKVPGQNVNRLNTLVAIRDVQFADADAGVPYAPPTATFNRSLATCSASGGIVVRSSNYANFQPILTPTGQGVIVGLYTRYDDAAQLIIRDTTDVRMYNPRCGNGATSLITIDSVRKLFTGGTVTLETYKITGVVISDKSTGNQQPQNLVLQQGDRGIVLRFTGTHTFNLGDSLTVNVTGGALAEYNSLLQISGLQTGAAFKSGTGTIVPRVTTIAQINSNFEAWESTLVKIANVTFPSGSYSGNKVISDGSGSITLYTIATATFANDNLPTGTKTITGITGQFGTTKQIQVRNLTDIQ